MQSRSIKKILINVIYVFTAISAAQSLWSYLKKDTNFLQQNYADKAVKLDLIYAPLPRYTTGENKIGFVSDRSNPTEREQSFYLAQFAFAPSFVIEGTEFPLIVADINHNSSAAKFIENNNFAVVAKSGDNIYLVKRLQ